MHVHISFSSGLLVDLILTSTPRKHTISDVGELKARMEEILRELRYTMVSKNTDTEHKIVQGG